jgi:hypothetical protein
MARFLYYVQDRQKAPPSDRPARRNGIAVLCWIGWGAMLASVPLFIFAARHKEQPAVEWHTAQSFGFQILPEPLRGEPYSLPCLLVGSRDPSGAAAVMAIEDLKLSRCYERT